MAEKQKHYKLGEKATIFWDPTQKKESARKLSVGQVKALQETEAVKRAYRNTWIVLATEDEIAAATKKAKPGTGIDDNK